MICCSFYNLKPCSKNCSKAKPYYKLSLHELLTYYNIIHYLVSKNGSKLKLASKEFIKYLVENKIVYSQLDDKYRFYKLKIKKNYGYDTYIIYPVL